MTSGAAWAMAERANALLLRSSWAAIHHDRAEQKLYLLEAVVLLRQCGDHPWPPNPRKTCAEVLAQVVRENRGKIPKSLRSPKAARDTRPTRRVRTAKKRTKR